MKSLIAVIFVFASVWALQSYTIHLLNETIQTQNRVIKNYEYKSAWICDRVIESNEWECDLMHPGQNYFYKICWKARTE